MKKIALMFQLMIYVQILPAQTLDSLNANNVVAFFDAEAGLFYKPEAMSGFVFPASPYNLYKATIFRADYWIAGIDVADTTSVYVMASAYNQIGQDSWAGPVADNYTEDYDNRYKRVFKITKSAINYHIANYNSLGYIVPDEILDWPAHGNTANSEAYNLAPFVDANLDGIYTPQLGDYPAIKGDVAIYIIRNDARNIHTESDGLAFGFEMHTLAYAYNAPDMPFLSNTVFVNMRLINRSSHTYSATLGMWIDFDIGDFYNDASGCDTLSNMIYGFNFGESDNYYANNPPAQACIFLNKNLYAHFTNLPDVQNTSLEEPQNYVNLLNGLFLDGSVITYGGNGTMGTIPTRYVLSGNPVTNEGWTVFNTFTSFPGDIRSIGAAPPFTIASNEAICFDWAFSAAIATEGAPQPNIASLALLQEYTSLIQNWYNANIGNCTIDPIYTDIAPARQFDTSITLNAFPNPATNMLWVDINSSINQLATVSLVGVTGNRYYNQIQQLKIGNNKLNLPLLTIPNALYFLEVQTKDSRVVHKLIKR